MFPEQRSVGSAKVFIVEDETLLAMLMEDILEELGYSIAFHASRLDAGLAFAMHGAFDLAILDINIIGGTSFPIAAAIAERDIPFIFCSGYGRLGIPPMWEHKCCVDKPFNAQQLEDALNALVAARD
jgi:CheY-like chemotaxis protein